MGKMRRFLIMPPVICTLWIALCFSLTSSVWLSWEYHLMEMVNSGAADLLTMVAGYLLQACGTGLAVFLLQKCQERKRLTMVCASFTLFYILSLPAVLGRTLFIAIFFGMLMNLFCGIIGGFYLFAAARTEAGSRGRVFGCGYAISTVGVYLLSLVGEGSFLRHKAVTIVYLVLAAACAWTAFPLSAAFRKAAASDAAELRKKWSGGIWATALATVCLLSVVKNMGFSFPSADFSAGIYVELSRIFYAAGLAAAGFINDRSRKNGAVCTAAALAIPFVMLALSGEKVPVLIFWGLSYLLFGFFSVFRTVVMMDMAVRSDRRELAPLGLMAGRAGDAAGTALCIGLGNGRIALIFLTLGLFALTMFLFFRLCQNLYAPETIRQKSEREVFEVFSIQHDLSAREKEVLKLVLTEQPNAQIAETLFVSESTVKYHVHNLLQKTGCKSRQELVKKYNMKLFSPSDQG